MNREFNFLFFTVIFFFSLSSLSGASRCILIYISRLALFRTGMCDDTNAQAHLAHFVHSFSFRSSVRWVFFCLVNRFAGNGNGSEANGNSLEIHHPHIQLAFRLNTFADDEYFSQRKWREKKNTFNTFQRHRHILFDWISATFFFILWHWLNVVIVIVIDKIACCRMHTKAILLLSCHGPNIIMIWNEK